jgi:hypothetical protein
MRRDELLVGRTACPAERRAFMRKAILAAGMALCGAVLATSAPTLGEDQLPAGQASAPKGTFLLTIFLKPD